MMPFLKPRGATTLAMACLCIAVAACAHTTSAPSVTPTVSEPAAVATFIVLRGGVEGAEHVETERLLLMSRSFVDLVAERSESSPDYTVERVGRSELLRVSVTGPEERAMPICRALVALAQQNAHAPSATTGAGTREWFEREIALAKAALEKANTRYDAFKKEHDLVVLSVEEQLEFRGQELKGLTLEATRALPGSTKRKQLEGAIAALRESALELNMLAVEDQNLRRTVDAAEARLHMLEERNVIDGLDGLMNPRLHLVDPCFWSGSYSGAPSAHAAKRLHDFAGATHPTGQGFDGTRRADG